MSALTKIVLLYSMMVTGGKPWDFPGFLSTLWGDHTHGYWLFHSNPGVSHGNSGRFSGVPTRSHEFLWWSYPWVWSSRWASHNMNPIPMGFSGAPTRSHAIPVEYPLLITPMGIPYEPNRVQWCTYKIPCDSCGIPIVDHPNGYPIWTQSGSMVHPQDSMGSYGITMGMFIPYGVAKKPGKSHGEFL